MTHHRPRNSRFRKQGLNNTRRRAIASLEFVLVLPFLAILTAVIFSVGIAGLAKTEAAIHSRHDAWKKRFQSLPKEAAPLPPDQGSARIVLGSDPVQPGAASELARKKVKLAPVLSVVNREGQAKHAVLGGAWDHRTIRFDQGSRLVPNKRFFVVAAAGVETNLFANINSVDSFLKMAGSGSSFNPQSLTQAMQSLIGPVMGAFNDLKNVVDDLSFPPNLISAGRDFGKFVDHAGDILANLPSATSKIQQQQPATGPNASSMVPGFDSKARKGFSFSPTKLLDILSDLESGANAMNNAGKDNQFTGPPLEKLLRDLVNGEQY